MARRPAHLERAGALTPRDRIWAAIRALCQIRPGVAHVQFSGAEVSMLSEIHVDTVMTYISGLIKAGFVSVALEGRPAAKRPRREFFLLNLARDVGVEAPRVNKDGKPVTAGLANGQMWLTLRVLKDFNADELALAASTPEQPISIEAAVAYVAALKRGRYLAVTALSKPGTKARFRFIRARNTGPRAPLIQRDRSVMDANTGEVVWRKP